LSEAAVEAAEAALQLHGGIGYTWELDVHLHLRRARANAVSLGDADYHRERIARHLASRYAS
jgi:alkylation response protein AidB-like acyl-CoA dehydrogenase